MQHAEKKTVENFFIRSNGDSNQHPPTHQISQIVSIEPYIPVGILATFYNIWVAVFSLLVHLKLIYFIAERDGSKHTLSLESHYDVM